MSIQLGQTTRQMQRCRKAWAVTVSPQTVAHMLLCHARSQGARTRHVVVSTLHA